MTLDQIEQQLRNPRPLIAAAAIACLAALGLVDCLLYQALRQGVDLDVAAIWLAVTLPPWTLCWLALQRQAAEENRAHRIAAAAATVLTAAFVAAMLDALAFPAESASAGVDLFQRVRAELPIGGAILALGLLQRRVPTDMPPNFADPRFELLLGADLCRAAGNYVEAIHAGRPRLVRATMAEAESFLASHGYIRVHRSAIVARCAIAGFEHARSGLVAVRLRGGEYVKVGRGYRPALYPLRREIGF
ncbi:MAG TPA: LytTR family DNA-binding domain-containing protein [Allosphingosinicella sp.]|uniref:LytTR family DNA-binding domain-containing protein n=1 Tax=Allosphingosinicella sp. TaxID=2823234 RepID=UPI002ED990EA